MRRALRILPLTVLLAGALAVTASAASAQQYPPSAPSVSASQNGSAIDVTSSGWLAGTDVTFQINPVLGTVTADANGVAVGTFGVPCSVGNGDHTITATGTAADGTPATATTGITITGCTTAAGTPGAATVVAGSLPFTGTSSTPWIGIGVVAVLLGMVLTVIGMRRRNRPTLQA